MHTYTHIQYVQYVQYVRMYVDTHTHRAIGN